MQNNVCQVSPQREQNKCSPKHAEFSALQVYGVLEVARASRASQEREGVIDGVLVSEGV
jgi:hypothetical protein